MREPSAARSFARFVTGLALDAVPASVVDTASLLALDTIGNALAAARDDFGRSILVTAARLGGPRESTGRLRERHGITADEIVDIRCRTAEGPIPRLWEPIAAKWAPPNGYAAKFSLPYLVAVMIVRGRAGLAEFTDEAVRDETVLRLARCVTYEIDPTIDYPRHFIGDVRARLRDGREVVERQEHPRGGPDHPMSREELTAKFRGNAALLLPADRVEAVVKHAAALRDQLRLDPLMQALADPAPAR